MVSKVNSYSFPSEGRLKHTSRFYPLINYCTSSLKSLAGRNNTSIRIKEQYAN